MGPTFWVYLMQWSSQGQGNIPRNRKTLLQKGVIKWQFFRKIEKLVKKSKFPLGFSHWKPKKFLENWNPNWFLVTTRRILRNGLLIPFRFTKDFNKPWSFPYLYLNWLLKIKNYIGIYENFLKNCRFPLIFLSNFW